jgi:hypothetical protein
MVDLCGVCLNRYYQIDARGSNAAQSEPIGADPGKAVVSPSRISA